MYLPKLIPYDIKQSALCEFEGIDRSKVCSENEFFDTLGLCSLEYPLICSAPQRYRLDEYAGAENEHAVFYNKGLGILSGSGSEFRLSFKGEDISSFEFTEGISSGNILNFNSKTLLIKGKNSYEFDPETKILDEIGVTLDIEAQNTSGTVTTPTLRLSLLYNDDTEPGEFSSGAEDAEFPSDASVGDCFARNLSYYRLIYRDQTNSANNEWQIQTSFKLRLEISEGHRKFKAGDYIRMKGLKYWNWTIRSFPELERFLRIEYVDSMGRYVTEPVEIFDNMMIILTKRKFPSNDIIGYEDPLIDNEGNCLPILDAELSACMPELDFVMGGSNRVWGCSNLNREIYASELGNARNWSAFEGISSDSYVLSIATPGDFTACINYLGTPVFFKENEMIVINGTRPSNFSLLSYSCRGVSKDSPSGLCVVNDILYYKSNDGIYAYSSSRPVCISEKLGDEIKELSDVIMLGEGDMLFVSGRKGDEFSHYCYDTLRGIWHRYYSKETVGYLHFPDACLEFCREGEVISPYTLFDGIPKSFEHSFAEKQDISWFWESSDIFYNTPDRKYIGRIRLDTECSGSSVLLISYDSEDFKKICDIPPHKRGSRDITLFPRRCNYFRIRMEGRGNFVMYTVTKEVEEAKENG